MSVRKGSKIIAGSYKVVKTDVYTREESDRLLDLKQNKLTAGKNITIDENNVISTSGGTITNIVQETGDSSDSVMSQYAVTNELNKKANLSDLSTVAITGDYIDLNNKPDLSVYPEIEDLSDVSFTGDYNDLSNTPTLGSVASTNNYNDLDNKPIIPSKTSQLDNDSDFITHHALLPYETIGSNDYKLSLKQNKLIAGNGITIEDDTISSGGSGGGLELGDIGIAPLGIDENQNKRRYLNGQIISQLQFVAFTTKLKSAVALYPTLACTEDEWQTTATMTVSGQVGKFVIDDIDKTIRLPRIIMPIQGLTDLRNLAEIVEAGLPQHNHSGTTSSNGAHTHTRGTMNITGGITSYENAFSDAYGALTASGWHGNANYHTAGTTNMIGHIGFDASKSWTGSTSSNGDHTHTVTTGDASNDLYGNSSTVQPEAIQYPYFIQVSTGVEESVNTDRQLELNTPFSLLEPKWSDKILNNPSWLRSYGQANSKFLYPDAYNYLLQEYNNGVEEAEIIDGVTIAYKRGAETNIKVTTDKIAYDAILSATGTAWYFIIDTTSETFYLPQTNGFFQFGGTGEFVKAGLPTLTTNKTGNHTHTRGTMNITGTLVEFSHGMGSESTNGAFRTTYSSQAGSASGSGLSYYDTTFDASRSWTGETSSNGSHNHTIEGTSDTVQPNAVKGYLYFYVGEVVQDANLINAGRVLEVLPEKLGSKLDSGDFYNTLTNCLLEVPQRIRYTLQDGTLTIHAGTVCIVPYGTEDKTSEFPIGSTFIHENFKVYDTCYSDGKFFVWVEVQSDIVDSDKTAGDNNIRPLQVDITQNNLFHFSITSSGTTDYDGEYNSAVYRTDLNIIKKWEMNIGLTSNISSLPICTIKSNASTKYVYESMPQVFNGMGYIGSTIWLDKGVKGLIPNGRNEDGSLKNIDFTITNVLTKTFDSNFTFSGLWLSYSRTQNVNKIAESGSRSYNEQENIIYNSGIAQLYCEFATCNVSAGKITSFNPKQPFRAVDYNDYNNTPHITETYHNGTSWYRVYSDGWCEQGGIFQGSEQDTTIKFLKPYKTLPVIHTHVYGYYNQSLLSGTADWKYMTPRAVSLNGFTICSSGYGTCWQSSGYIT